MGDRAGDLDRWRPLHLLTTATATCASSRRSSRSRVSASIPRTGTTCAAQPSGWRASSRSRAAEWWRPTATLPCWPSGSARPARPTILVYGHYDVQPPGDESRLDDAAVRAATVRDGRIYGARRDRRQGACRRRARDGEGAFAANGALPLNVRFLIEGEEEIGSPSLPAFLEEQRDELACDLVVSADGAMWRPGRARQSRSPRRGSSAST